MSVAEYLDLPAEDLTPEMYSSLVELAEKTDQLEEFEELWHVDELPSMDNQLSKSIWQQINNRLDGDLIAANEEMEPVEHVSDFTYNVA